MQYEITNFQYTGKAPALCKGDLRVTVNGIPLFFRGISPCTCFWRSGGFFDDQSGEYVRLPWELDWDTSSCIPKDLAEALIEEFNKQVPPGCCAGCE